LAQVRLYELETFTLRLLQAAGLQEDHARTVADVFMRATYRGVGHHDVYDLPGRLEGLVSGKVNPKPEIKRLHQYAALESYEGDNGLGELCAMFMMERAQQLADEFGIGLCAVRNTNHILASSPYVEAAAENGYIGYIITRGAPTMGAPGRVDKVIGTSPMGYAVPTDKGYPLMFDACIAYASNGVLADKIKQGEKVPAHWGVDADGVPTDDPAQIAKGARQPIGGHKGFGLTIFGEMLTGILSEGQIIDEPQPGTGAVGMPSHTAICIKADALLGDDRLRRRTTEMIDRMQARAAGLQIPGERSAASKARLLQDGQVELEGRLIAKLNDWAARLGVVPVTTI
jgi:LDH2 family malate/lactate/ureidoglycolate dehydrogenase